MSWIPRNIPYLPLLELRPAEMAALEELPDKDKELLLPSFRLRPWVGSHALEKSLKRLRDAYGQRRAILELGEPEFVATPRPVHQELDMLRRSSNGYESWVSYLRDEASEFIPTVQLGEPVELSAQLNGLHGLGRGVCFRISRSRLTFLPTLLQAVKNLEFNGVGFIFILDFDTISPSSVQVEPLSVKSYVDLIAASVPAARIAVSSSSFPTGFVGRSSQNIYERDYFDAVQTIVGSPLIYSDHASARVEVQRGGGGVPAPRIDYAGSHEWTFFREDSGDSDREACYRRQALNCLKSPVWDSRLMVWGKQMVERTAYGDEGAITSPPKATAARINMHLHQQLFYGNSEGLYDTDEEWSE